MTKRSLSLLALTVALALPLSACGSSSGTTATSSSTSETMAPTSSAPAPTTTSAAPVDYHLITAGTLTVCSDVPYPPFEDFDKSAPSGFKGFDIDIVSQIASDLGLQLVVKDSDFTALKSGLAIKTKQCDLVASAMTITAARAKVMAFSDGYYDANQSLLVAADSGITNLAGTSGMKIGVQDGTTGQDYAKANAPSDTKLVVFSDDGTMWAALKSGQIAGILQDLPVNIDHQNNSNGKYTVVETYNTNEQYGLAMSLDNTTLVDAVNADLATMKSDGTYQTIYDKYFKIGG